MTEGVFPVKIIDTKIFWTVNLELMLLELSRFFRKFAINDLIPNAKNVTAIRRIRALVPSARGQQAIELSRSCIWI